ncbi:MAG: hypothetical protein ACI4J7_05875 [Ruminiclostridium sp.]
MDNELMPAGFLVSVFATKLLNEFVNKGYWIESCHFNENSEVVEIIFRDDYENRYRIDLIGIEPET